LRWMSIAPPPPSPGCFLRLLPGPVRTQLRGEVATLTAPKRTADGRVGGWVSGRRIAAYDSEQLPSFCDEIKEVADRWTREREKETEAAAAVMCISTRMVGHLAYAFFDFLFAQCTCWCRNLSSRGA
jgi:hypothetical protein